MPTLTTRTWGSCLCALALCGWARAEIEDGLLLHYDFNSDEGAVATDRSGHHRNAEVRGAQWISEGIGGGAYHFTREDDLIFVSDDGLPMGDAPRSISCWISLDSLRPPFHATHLIHYGTVDYSRFFSLGVDWRVGRDCPTASPWGYVFISNSRIDRVGQWYHVVCTYGGNGRWQFYMNGQLTAGIPESRAPLRTEAGGKFLVGTFKAGYHNLDGRIDEVRVYDRVLTRDEVATLFDQGRDLVYVTPAIVERSPNAAGVTATGGPFPRSVSKGASADSSAIPSASPPGGAVVQPNYQITTLGFSTREDGDQDVTIFYPDETLHIRVQDVDLVPENSNVLVRAALYQRSDRSGEANYTMDLSRTTNGDFRAAVPLNSLQPGRALVDIAAYDFGGQVLRLFRTSPITILPRTN